MISKDNYGAEHIRQIQNDNHSDPALIERTLFAFGLLEALANVGLNFIFKGGTSLMLLLPKPMRLSTDIDIVVAPGTDIDSYIEKARTIFPFKDGGEQERRKGGNIEKRHFKFIYDSPVSSDDTLYILLDILFEEDNYEQTIQTEIKNDLLLTEGENLSVRIPSIDCVLGDKLTAFAPHTTGIPLGNKNLEVMKQFFDVSSLIDECSDFESIRNTYNRISSTEISYRDINITPKDALKDSIRSAICIGSRGALAPEDFLHYLDGSRRIVQHIFSMRFSMEEAAKMAPKIIYMAACLLTDTPFQSIDNPADYKQESLAQKDFQLLKKIRKPNPMGYAYLVKADRLLSDYEKP